MAKTQLRVYEQRLGHKKIYGIEQENGEFKIMSDCSFAGPCAAVVFMAPGAAAVTYFETDRAHRPNIQTLFPDLPLHHREILVSGTSPAEFDETSGAEMPDTKEAFMAKYGPLGYVIEED